MNPARTLSRLIRRGLWPFALAASVAPPVPAAPVTEIVYEDREPEAAPYVSRILIEGQRMRLDYGRDDEDFILFDGKSVYLVSHWTAGITEIMAGRAKPPAGKEGVKVESEPRGAERVVTITIDGRQCAEFRSAPLLPREMAVMTAFRQAMAANQAASWERTPADLRDACDWVMDTQEAGVEYRYGLPMSIRYANGRSRTYMSHAGREVPDRLFELPAGYRRVTIRLPE